MTQYVVVYKFVGYGEECVEAECKEDAIDIFKSREPQDPKEFVTARRIIHVEGPEEDMLN